ncbi:GH25 family lysozyme [Saxibacter everestensis]|uniref:GH25 family lysozyme n=1 Tax=Saxibacter everestensis TaxID=2909229 RepID=A0ABY8QQ27_9MICO|nr:GH25 family lysozyme [Brevibacteriaceae bacterium ZFBP1038]
MTRRARRALLVTAAGLVLLLMAASLWWYAIVPNTRPGLRPGEAYAIDVSHHQGKIDWARVHGDGVRYAYIKATEGNDHLDSEFSRNWTASAGHGVSRGAYHFFTLCSPGEEQAVNFLKAAPPEAGALPPAVDLELIGACQTRPSQRDVSRELAAFTSRVEAEWGRELLVYARHSWLQQYTIEPLSENRRWVTNFFIRPFHDDWTVWQVHYFAYVDGARGKVDLDVVRPADLKG